MCGAISSLVRCSVAVLALGGLATSGCSDGKPDLVPVSGQVLIDGEPLTLGSIQFVPTGARPSGGTIDSSGHFVLSCYEPGDGAIVGKHMVKITAVEPIDGRSNRWLAPKKYSNAHTSGIEVAVSKPVDDLKIELTWDGGAPFVERW